MSTVPIVSRPFEEVVEVHVTGGEIDGVLHLDSLPFVGSILL